MCFGPTVLRMSWRTRRARQNVDALLGDQFLISGSGKQHGGPLKWVAGPFYGLSKRQGPPVVPFYPFLGEGSSTKKSATEKKGTLSPHMEVFVG